MSETINKKEAKTKDTTVATVERKVVNKKQNELLKQFNLTYYDIDKINKKYTSDDAPLITPLKYPGHKYKLIPQIAPLIKNDINTFYDLFGGSFTMGINIDADQYVYNELNPQISNLIKSLSKGTVEGNFKEVLNIFDKYELHQENKNGFLKLRNDYNTSNVKPWSMLYTLAILSIRGSMEFDEVMEKYLSRYNKGSFNDSLRAKFILFTEKLIEIADKVDFSNKSALDMLHPSNFKKNDFVYLDPAYLIASEKYGVTWKEKEEKEFLSRLDISNDNDVDFALSNKVY